MVWLSLCLLVCGSFFPSPPIPGRFSRRGKKKKEGEKKKKRTTQSSNNPFLTPESLHICEPGLGLRVHQIPTTHWAHRQVSSSKAHCQAKGPQALRPVLKIQPQPRHPFSAFESGPKDFLRCPHLMGGHQTVDGEELFLSPGYIFFKKDIVPFIWL